jgi:hypothetical protein
LRTRVAPKSAAAIERMVVSVAHIPQSERQVM